MTTDDALLIIAVGACVVAVAACVLARYLVTQAGAWKAPYWRTSERIVLPGAEAEERTREQC